MTQISQIDPRQRKFVLPTRIVRQSEGADAPLENLSLLTSDVGQAPLESKPSCTIANSVQPTSLLLNFGQELNGGVQIVVGQASRVSVQARLCFGESVSEVIGQPNNDHANHSLMFLLAAMGTQKVGNTGFRFMRTDFPPGIELHLAAVRAVSLLRPLDHLGTFECSGSAPQPDNDTSYSLWWIFIQRDWYWYHGNFIYLRQQHEYLAGLLAQIEAATNAGLLTLVVRALVVRALRAGAELCVFLGDKDTARGTQAVANRAAGFQRAPSARTTSASALRFPAGMADAGRVNRGILAQDPFRGLSTFYGYHSLQARALANGVRLAEQETHP